MTKQQELEILDAAIKALGQQSYLGPWLSENRDAIERDITSDLQPSPDLPAEAVKRARAIITDAQKTAADIVTAGNTEAERRKRETHDHILSARNRAVTMLRKAAEDIDPYRYMGVRP